MATALASAGSFGFANTFQAASFVFRNATASGSPHRATSATSDAATACMAVLEAARRPFALSHERAIAPIARASATIAATLAASTYVAAHSPGMPLLQSSAYSSAALPSAFAASKSTTRLTAGALFANSADCDGDARMPRRACTPLR